MDFECAICLSIFEDPRLLSCGHSFCKKCLLQLLGIGTKNALQCPECRNITELRKGGVESLSVNWVLLRFMESNKGTESSVSPSLVASAAPDTSSTTVKCQTHAREANRFCKQCKEVVCAHCPTSKHESHHMLSISAAQAELSTIYQSMVSESTEMTTICRQKQLELSKAQESLGAGLREKISQIRTAISRSIEELQLKEQELISKVSAQASSLQTLLEGETTELGKSTSRLVSTHNHLRSLALTAGISDTFAPKQDVPPQIWNNMRELQEAIQACHHSSASSTGTSPVELASSMSNLDPNIFQQPVRLLTSTLERLTLDSIESLSRSISFPGQASQTSSHAPTGTTTRFEPTTQSYTATPSQSAAPDRFSPTSSLAGGVSSSTVDHHVRFNPQSALSGMSTSYAPAVPPLAQIREELWNQAAAAAAPVVQSNLFSSPFSQPYTSAAPAIPQASVYGQSSAAYNMHYASAPGTVPLQPSAPAPSADSHSGVILTSSPSASWRAWELPSLEDLYWPNLFNSQSPVVCAAQNPLYASTVFVVLDDGTAGVVDMHRKELVRPTWSMTSRGPRRCLVAEDPNAFDNPAFIVIADVERSINVYSKDAQLIYTNTVAAVITAVYAWHGELFIGMADGSITQQQLFGKRLVETWKGHDSPVTCISVLPVPLGTDLILTGSYDMFLKAWRTDNCRMAWQVRHSRAVTSFSCAETSFQDLGSVVASGAEDGAIYIYSNHGKLITSFSAHGSGITCVELSSDSNVLVSASGVQDPTVKVWDWQNTRPVAMLSGHTHGIFNLKIFAKGTRAASVSNDGSIRIWDLTNNSLLTRLIGHSSALTAFCICEGASF